MPADIQIPQGVKRVFSVGEFFDQAGTDPLPAIMLKPVYWSVSTAHGTIYGGASDVNGNLLDDPNIPSLYGAVITVTPGGADGLGDYMSVTVPNAPDPGVKDTKTIEVTFPVKKVSIIPLA